MKCVIKFIVWVLSDFSLVLQFALRSQRVFELFRKLMTHLVLNYMKGSPIFDP